MDAIFSSSAVATAEKARPRCGRGLSIHSFFCVIKKVPWLFEGSVLLINSNFNSGLLTSDRNCRALLETLEMPLTLNTMCCSNILCFIFIMGKDIVIICKNTHLTYGCRYFPGGRKIIHEHKI